MEATSALGAIKMKQLFTKATVFLATVLCSVSVFGATGSIKISALPSITGATDDGLLIIDSLEGGLTNNTYKIRVGDLFAGRDNASITIMNVTNIYVTYVVSSNTISANIQGTTNKVPIFGPDSFSLTDSIITQDSTNGITVAGAGDGFVTLRNADSDEATMEIDTDGNWIVDSTGDFFFKNDSTTLLKVSATSGYAGGGTKVLTDDGTYKSVSAAGGAVGANPTASIGLSAVNGSAATFMRSDAAPALESVGTPGTYGDSTHFIGVTTDAAGRVTAVTTTALPAGVSAANPTASVGLTAVNGSASTFLRSDGAPALSQSIAPTWTGAHVFDSTLTVNKGMVQTLETVSYNASTTIDLDPTAHPNMRVETLSGNLTISVSNKAAGRWFTLFIVGDGSSRTLSLPSWKFMNITAPTTLAANKTASLTVFYTDGTDANAIANYAVQP